MKAYRVHYVRDGKLEHCIVFASDKIEAISLINADWPVEHSLEIVQVVEMVGQGVWYTC